jgi:hypothetical protein
MKLVWVIITCVIFILILKRNSGFDKELANQEYRMKYNRPPQAYADQPWIGPYGSLPWDYSSKE